MRSQKGQMILLLIVIMTVALAIGLSVVQKSLVDVSTASKVEQSSRAFSAAEAGIEKALLSDSSVDLHILDNNSKISRVDKSIVPATGQALEYPPLAKEEVAQVWLADPTSNLPNCDAGKTCYAQTALDVYWGTIGSSDNPAIEITVVYLSGSVYQSGKYYFDSTTRSPANGFTLGSCNFSDHTLSTSLGIDRKFYCKASLDLSSTKLPGLIRLILLRARLLYNTTSQPFAVKPASGYSLPAQGRLFTSTGASGETQRKVQVFQLYKVVPPYFDYAIFSSGEINK